MRICRFYKLGQNKQFFTWSSEKRFSNNSETKTNQWIKKMIWMKSDDESIVKQESQFEPFPINLFKDNVFVSPHSRLLNSQLMDFVLWCLKHKHTQPEIKEKLKPEDFASETINQLKHLLTIDQSASPYGCKLSELCPTWPERHAPRFHQTSPLSRQLRPQRNERERSDARRNPLE